MTDNTALPRRGLTTETAHFLCHEEESTSPPERRNPRDNHTSQDCSILMKKKDILTRHSGPHRHCGQIIKKNETPNKTGNG